MATKTKVAKWTVDAIIELGLEVIGETVEHMKTVDVNDRDGEFAKSMTAFSRAACEISKELREAAAFVAAKKLSPEDINGILIEHLRSLSADERAALFLAAGPLPVIPGQSGTEAHV